MKNPLTPAGIEPATFRFVAQHLNHCTTAVPILGRWKFNYLKLGPCIVLYTNPVSTAEKYNEETTNECVTWVTKRKWRDFTLCFGNYEVQWLVESLSTDGVTTA